MKVRVLALAVAFAATCIIVSGPAFGQRASEFEMEKLRTEVANLRQRLEALESGANAAMRLTDAAKVSTGDSGVSVGCYPDEEVVSGLCLITQSPADQPVPQLLSAGVINSENGKYWTCAWSGARYVYGEARALCRKGK